MPYSSPFFDNNVKDFIKNHRFMNYLDVGAGAGKYGAMIREVYPQAKIVAIEPDKEYIRKFKLSKIYDEIISKKAEEYFFTLPDFKTEVCIIGDCIEHLKKSDGIDLINYLVYRTHYIILIFPSAFIQYSYEGHALEAHISVWNKSDFAIYKHKFFKKPPMNMVIIQGYLSDPHAITLKESKSLTRLFAKLFNKEVNNDRYV